MKRITTLFFLFFSCLIISQTKVLPEKEITYGNNSHTNRDYLRRTLKDKKDNIYLIGTTENDFTFNDLKIIKLDKNLNLLWEKEKSHDLGISFDLILNAKIDSQNNLIVESSSGYDSQNQTFIILKYNENGDLLWEKPLADLTNVKSHVYHTYNSSLDQFGNLHIKYQEKEGEESVFKFISISPEGNIINEFNQTEIFINSSGNVKRFKEVIDNGTYNILTVENTDSTPSKKFTLHIVNNNTRQSFDLNLDATATSYFNTPFGESWTIMKKDNSGNFVLIAPSYDLYKDYGIMNINSDGSIKYLIYPDETYDKYPLDFGFDDDNNLIIVSNNRLSNTSDQLKFTLQKYNPDGNLIFEKSISKTANISKIENSKILLHDYNNEILTYDFNLNLLESAQLSSINTYNFSSNEILNIGSNYYLSGHTNDVNFNGSDYLSELDILIQKSDKNGVKSSYSFSGNGTSKVLELRDIVVETDSYKLSFTEKLGPENHLQGSASAPHQQRFLTLNKDDLSITEDKIVPLNDFLITTYYPKNLTTEYITEDNIKYEYVLNEEKTNLTLFKNEVQQWTRDLNLYIDPNGDEVISDNELILECKINKNGDFYILTYIYGLQKSSLYQFSLTNDLIKKEFEEPTFVIEPLSNNWLFTLNKIGTRIIYSNRLTEINKSLFSSYQYPNVTSSTFFIKEKYNQILFNRHGDNRISIFNQYGDLQDKYFELEANLENSNNEYDNEYLILLEDVGRSIYLSPEYAWNRAVIKKFNLNLSNTFQDLSELDDDNDGVKNGIDECRDTPNGEVVDDYGCSKNQTLSSDEFNLKDSYIEIFPNPTNGFLNIRQSFKNTNILKVTIFDQIGRKVLSSNYSEIDLSNQSNGIYYLSFYLDNHQTITKRIIKK